MSGVKVGGVTRTAPGCLDSRADPHSTGCGTLETFPATIPGVRARRESAHSAGGRPSAQSNQGSRPWYGKSSLRVAMMAWSTGSDGS